MQLGKRGAGEATYNRDADRPLLRAALRSASANLWDLASLVGVSHRLDATSTQKAAEPQESDSGVAAAEPGRAGRIFPARPIRAERLKIIDAHVTMDAKKLNTPGMPALESLRFAAALENGALQLNTIDLGVAGGHAVGTLAFNGQHQPPSSSAAIDVRNVRLEKLFPSLPAKAQSTGVIRAQIELSGQGNSIAAIIGSATGSLAAVMDRGRISNLLDAKLALDGGKILGSLIRGERDIALNCAAVAFDIRKGVGKSQFIMLDTEQTHVDGIATLNLRAERFELVLTPQPKNPGLFTLRSSIKGEGSFRRARFSVDKRVAVDHAGRAAAPATLNALLRPLVESGRSGDGTCGAFLGAKPTVRNAAAAIE